MEKDHYRDDVEELIEEQNRKKVMIEIFEQLMKEAHPGADRAPKPACPYDGKPCLTPGKGCEATFGSFDGKDEVFWRCPRFPER